MFQTRQLLKCSGARICLERTVKRQEPERVERWRRVPPVSSGRIVHGTGDEDQSILSKPVNFARLEKLNVRKHHGLAEEKRVGNCARGLLGGKP